MALYRDSARYLLGRGGPALISLLTAAIYTRLVPPDELGRFVLTLSFTTVANSVLFQWLLAGTVRFAPRYRDRRSTFLRTIRLAWAALAAIAVLIGVILWLVLEGHPARPFVPLGVVALCGLAFFELNLDLMRSQLAAGRYGTAVLLRATLTLIFSWQLARLGYGSRGLLLGFAAGWFLASVWTLPVAWRAEGPGAIDSRLLGQFLRHGTPLMAAAPLEGFIMTSDRLLLGWLRGPIDAGLYGASAILATNSLSFLLHALSLAALPLVVKALETRGEVAARADLKKGLRVLLTFGLPASVGLVMLAGNVTHVVLGASYRDAAASLLPLLTVATLLCGLRTFYVDQSFQLGRRTELQAWIAGAAAAGAVGANLLLIPRFGALGAAWTLVGIYGLALVVSWRLSQRVFPLPGLDSEFVGIGISTASMALALWWLAPARGPLALALQIAAGLGVYAASLPLTGGVRARETLARWLSTDRSAPEPNPDHKPDQGRRHTNPRSVEVDVLGVPIAAVDMDDTVARIEAWVADDARTFINVTSVHGIIEGQRSAVVRTAHRLAGMCVPDGMPIVWVGWLYGHRNIRRVYGPDLMLEVCRRSADGRMTHYFYGGREGVPEMLRDRLLRRFPGLRVVGTCSPPFRPMTQQEETALARNIETVAPDVLWVGLGTPKQDQWMAGHVGKLNAKVMVGVGAAFDFHAGLLRQPPRWMQGAGLEWLFRLGVEPRRLWRRYLFDNPYFIAKMAGQLLGWRRHDP